MLVLRRRKGEAIRIGENIRIVISDVQDGRIVRFAIDAPPEIPVHRGEIHRLIQRENRAAAGDILRWMRQAGTPALAADTASSKESSHAAGPDDGDG